MSRTREYSPIDVGQKSVVGCADAIVSTDGELLMRFVRHRDHGAFAEIVERHGGLVWIVCREVLRHHQDIEDAFQATFFILAKRADSIRLSESAAAWLYKVAQRTSLATRRKRSQRREEELAIDPPVGEEALFMLPERETLYVLLRELGALPDHYRTPLVLRYLEGQSRRSIAEQTDSTVAQIQGRLVRGRRMLRLRMLRRGVSLSIATGALAGATATAKAAVTPAVVVATAKSCLALTATGAAAGATAAAIQLAKQGANAMWLASIMKTAAAVSTALVAAGALWAAQAGGDGQARGAVAPVGGQVIDLNIAAAASELAGQGGTVLVSTGDQSQPPRLPTEEATVSKEEAEKKADQQLREKKFVTQVTELRKRVATSQKEKLDYIQLLAKQKTEESLIQRELERTHEALLNLRISSDDGETEDAMKKRAVQVDKLQTLVEDLKERLATALRDAALTSAQVEQVDLELSELSKMNGELARMKLQMEFALPQTAPPRGASGATAEPHIMGFGTGSASPTTTMTVQTQSAESLPEALIVQPMKTVRIRVTGAYPDAPIDGVFSVEPMGTVPLGPQYGRVKVAGLPILEAEAAIKQELSKTLNNPEVQLTIVGPNSTWEAAVPPPNAVPSVATTSGPNTFAAASNPLTLSNRSDAAASPAHIKQLELEREAAELRAKALLGQVSRTLAQVESGQAIESEALLLESDAKLAQAKCLELTRQIEALQTLLPQVATTPKTSRVNPGIDLKPGDQISALRTAVEALQKENEKLKKELEKLKAEKTPR